MTVPVQQRLAFEAGRRDFLCLDELTEEERLPRQCLGSLIAREQIQQFVSEDGDAAGLESDDRDAGLDFGRQLVEDFQEQFFRSIEHAKVVQGASAAEVGVRDYHPKASALENFDGGLGGCGLEIVVESVGPEQNRRTVYFRLAAPKPAFESLGSEGGDASLHGN